MGRGAMPPPLRAAAHFPVRGVHKNKHPVPGISARYRVLFCLSEVFVNI